MTAIMGAELLRGERVRLVRPTPEDAAAVARWSHDMGYQRDLRRGMVYPGEAAEFEGWFREMLEKQEGFPFSARRLEDDALIGMVILNNLYWQARHATLVLAVDPVQHGRGYGTDITRVILKYAFMEMNLHRVGLDVLAYNVAARRVYEKVGFTLEGTLREFVWRDGVYYDMHTMGILRHEWARLNGVVTG